MCVRKCSFLAATVAARRAAAKKAGVQLYLPLIVPAGFGFIGSFGGITRFKGFVPNRETLLDVAVAGPLWGSAASGVLLLLGLGLSAAGLGDVSIDSPALADSFLVALLGQFALGDALANPEVSCTQGVGLQIRSG
jgi:Zn-dependent protease